MNESRAFFFIFFYQHHCHYHVIVLLPVTVIIIIVWLIIDIIIIVVVIIISISSPTTNIISIIIFITSLSSLASLSLLSHILKLKYRLLCQAGGAVEQKRASALGIMCLRGNKTGEKIFFERERGQRVQDHRPRRISKICRFVSSYMCNFVCLRF